ncbi:MAG: rod shape-determining protein [Flavobacteriales bacterium]|jgi:rod shape-determining protein MreB|nr:rod shape-determining protein [Flavobacteriales bacterium]MDC3258391.1 rod shape-determining protein [Flavobacteriales bacterium]MDG1283365.1 rod shape-determining protein [Flavobacteriales bacterium]MDG1426643.1 rod shape-determining protein [Flavobacteriales bacterium]MDG1933941.1 rod shape-determining protein [Flavobacteriales bacterium]|tara:strand:- start:11566 stop:12588 length:1023 start_codon:yes stop_codon:yes gene_type:complete
MGLFDFMQEAIAIDLGTANTLIIHNDKVVVDEPSIVAKNIRTGEVVAIGKRAQQMHGKTHQQIETLRPLKDGVIADFQASEQMIRGFIEMLNMKGSVFAPSLKMVVCIPSGVTEVEKRAVIDSAEHAGAKDVWLIHEPMAAAIGIGIDVLEPKGNMVIDIGGGTTEIAVISLGGIVCDKSIRVAGDELTANIQYHMKTRHNIAIGDIMAEQIKIHCGSALTELEDPPPNYAVHGRDLMSGIPKEVIVTYKEIAGALSNSIEQIEEAVMSALFNTPPALSADIYNEGLYLTGGGSMLRGLDKRISKKTKLPVYVAEDPLRAVARGTGIALKNTDRYTFLMR